MKTVYLSLACVLCFCLWVNAQPVYWNLVSEQKIIPTAKRVIIPKKYATYQLNSFELKNVLFSAPNENEVSLKNSAIIIYLPMPDGSLQKFKVVECPIISGKLAEFYPNIKTFNAMGIDDPYAYAKLDWNDFGFHGMIRSPHGDVFIDPYTQNFSDYYISYFKSDFEKPYNQRITEEILFEEGSNPKSNEYFQNVAAACMGAQLRTYRLAVACTYEYAVAATGTTTPTKSQVLSKVVTTVNRVDGVYETDLAIRLVLIENDTVILYNTSNDPFSGNNNSSILIVESQSVITSNIGTNNFDIGHTFSTGGGGLANLGCVCKASSKASGITGSPSPVGDPYDIDYVAHEIGHQFGGNHTFAANTGSCSGNRNTNTSQEPGSGVTIMGYAGICGSDNIANNSIPYFHPVSYNEIITYVTTGSGKNCPIVTNTGNNPPVVSIPPIVYTVPIKTPFALKGNAVDPDGDPLTFSWEEIDNGPPSGGSWNSGNKPFFRSFAPVVDTFRLFPKLSNLLLANFAARGEYFPTTNQTLNFQLTARDNKMGGGGVCMATTQLKVDVSVGPFAIVSPNTSGIVYPSGSTQTLSWSVNGTDGAPINVSLVNIYLSLDNGNTFQPLLMGTPNDGIEDVTLPVVSSDVSTCRYKIEGVNHIILDINDRPFKITAITTGFNSISASNQLGVLVTPNPFSKNFNLSVEGIDGQNSSLVEIFDVLGKRVYSKTFAPKIDNEEIKLSELNSGIYFVKVVNGHREAIQRIVKE